MYRGLEDRLIREEIAAVAAPSTRTNIVALSERMKNEWFRRFYHFRPAIVDLEVDIETGIRGA